jgi:hypothetical protein
MNFLHTKNSWRQYSGMEGDPGIRFREMRIRVALHKSEKFGAKITIVVIEVFCRKLSSKI